MTPLTEKLERKLEFNYVDTFERSVAYASAVAYLPPTIQARRHGYNDGARDHHTCLRPILDQLILCVSALEPARNWQADDEPMKSLLLKAQQAITQLEKVLDEK